MATDWNEIFVRHPDLNPPGYDEVIQDMQNNPWKPRGTAVPPHKKARSKPGKQGRGSQFPGLKHTTQD